MKIHVYLKTGTVATCLDHPSSGKTQLFRRNNSIRDIEDIFENPRQHTGRGYYKCKLDSPEEIGHINSNRYASRRIGERATDDRFKKIREKVNVKTIHSISLGVDGFFILYCDGTYDSANIPSYLYEKLTAKDFEEEPIPEVVALGTHHDESYFVQFADGTQSYRNIPRDLERDLKNAETKVIDVIAFGGFSNTYFYVRFLDGTCNWCLSERLSDRLSNKFSHLKVENISIGNHHESSAYAVKFTNGGQTVNMKGKYFYEELDRYM